MLTQSSELKGLKKFVQFAKHLQDLAGPAAYEWLVSFTEGVTEIGEGEFTFYDPGVPAKDIVPLMPSIFSLANLDSCAWARQVRASGLKRLRILSKKSLNRTLTNQIHFLKSDEHLVYVAEMMVFVLLMNFENRPFPFLSQLIRTGDQLGSRLLFGVTPTAQRFTTLLGIRDEDVSCIHGDIGIAGISLEQ